MDTKKLRQKILDLAIHGKLVPQDPNDEPASVLLQRIRTEKERLIKEGKIKRSRKSVKTSDTPHYEQMPFELPQGWVWCRLDDTCQIFGRIGFRGYTKEDLVEKGKGAITLSPSNIVNNCMNYDNCTYISWAKYEESPEIKVDNNDILLVKTGSSFGKCALVLELPFQATINPQFVVLKSITIHRHYLTHVLQSQYAREVYDNFVLGTAIPTFTQVALGNMRMPLPPFAEQQRIVDEVERWFKLIDTIEQGKADLQTAIKQAKNKILELAISGKLVPQDPTDEPASELLKRINPKAHFTCDNEHYPHLPKGWCTCRLEEVFDMLMGQSPEGGSINSSEGIEFHQGKIFFTEKFLSKSHYYTSEPIRVSPANSLLLCVRAPVGAVNLSLSDVCIGRGLCSLHPKECLELQYAFYCLTTYQNLFEQQSTGSTFKSISKDIIRNQDFALPPLAEQKRIVEKIEQLFRLLEQIDENL